MKYMEFKKKHEKIINEYISTTCFFAYDDKQFYEGLNEFGIKTKEVAMEFFTVLGGGGFILRNKVGGLEYLINRKIAEWDALIEMDNEFVFDMFTYELGNYEYVYSCDDYTVISACNLTVDEIKTNKRLLNIYTMARENYLNTVIA